MTEYENGDLLRVAMTAALDGAREVLDVYRGPFEVKCKDDSSPVTAADHKSQAAILAKLRREFPGIPVLSEEGAHADYELRSLWPVCWLVDPLDGTKEFVRRNGEFTINIALVQDGSPRLGVVYVPLAAMMYWGSTAGAFRAVVPAGAEEPEERAQEVAFALGAGATPLPLATQSADTVSVVVSRSHADQATADYLRRLEARGRPVLSLAAGSARKTCLLAEGVADVYPRFGPTMEWDTAAGQAILEATGGRMVDVRTRERLAYNKPTLVNPPFVGLAVGRDVGYFLD
jgi:3'(2'), 5'-bisphosphate nucleotidase